MHEKAAVAAKTLEAKKQISIHQAQRTRISQSISSPVDHILFLQRTIGNQAVQKLIKSGMLQAKLKISQPEDKYEQEADRVAEKVMRMQKSMVLNGTVVSDLGSGNPIQRRCSGCIKGLQPRNEKEEEILRKKEACDSTSEDTPELESRINAIRGGGKPLPEAVRAFYEPRFGYDFSRVRVHNDTKAALTARAVNANAYTVGHDVVFGDGQYTPATMEGRRLLAHELTHVIQQKGLSGSIFRLTKGEETAKKAQEWVGTDAKLKIEVDVLKAAIREIKMGKSVEYNKSEGIKRLDSASKLLAIKPEGLDRLKDDWKWLVDNRKSNAQESYKKKEAGFFEILKSPLKKLKEKFPKAQTHYWLKNAPAQVLEIIHKVADAQLPANELWAYAFKEGLVDYIRDEIGLAATDDPAEAQLKSVSVAKTISGFDYLGLDDFMTELSAKREPLRGFLPAGFNLSKVKEVKKINEKGREVKSGEFPNMLMAVQALSAMLKRRRKLFQEDAKTNGYSAPDRNELVYWTYIYFNFGEFGGKQQLERYRGKRNLSDWIKKGEFPNAIKLLQSYQMVQTMKLF